MTVFNNSNASQIPIWRKSDSGTFLAERLQMLPFGIDGYCYRNRVHVVELFLCSFYIGDCPDWSFIPFSH